MSATTIAFIVLFEVLALMLVAIVVLVFQVRKLKALLRQRTQAASKPEKLAEELAEEAEEPPPMETLEASSEANEPSGDDRPGHAQEQEYADYVDEQLLTLREHYHDLPGAVDIPLDLDKDAPLERKVVAMRHAFLIAEREAATGNKPDWAALQARYRQLIGCFGAEQAEKRAVELEKTLQEAQQQVSQMSGQLTELGEYRQRYLDIENRWHNSHEQAVRHRDEIIAKVGGKAGDNTGEYSDELISMVDNYHNSYDAVANQFRHHEPLKIKLDVAQNEISSLRATASQQRDIIDQLQARLRNAGDDNTKTQLIRELESELQRQTRFIAECESCVKLMEDELSAAHQTIQNFEYKMKELPVLRMQLLDMTQDAEARDATITRLKTDLALLKSVKNNDVAIATAEPVVHADDTAQLDDSQVDDSQVDDSIQTGGGSDEGSSPQTSVSVDTEDVLSNKPGAQVEQLQVRISKLQAQYADLEERYLDLKLEQG